MKERRLRQKDIAEEAEQTAQKLIVTVTEGLDREIRLRVGQIDDHGLEGEGAG